jgi:hypothetical protein
VSAFVRTQDEESLLVVHNLSKSEVTVALPETLTSFSKVHFKSNKGAKQKGASVVIPAYSSVVLKK